MNIIYTNFIKKSVIRWIVINIKTKDKLFSCVLSYQKMFKTFEVRKNCFLTIITFLIISHLKIDVEKI